MSRHAPVARIARWVVALTLAAHPAWAQERDRFAARLELGAGSMLSTFQRNEDRAAFNGDAKGYNVGLHAALRFAWSITDAFALQASLSNWVFPTNDGRPTGWVFAPMLGARFEPSLGAVGRAFVDANLGVGMTGDERALQVDVGAGFEFPVSPSLSVGPVVRYGQTVQPDTRGDGQPDPYPDDARYLVAGLSLSLRSAEPAAPRPEPVAAVRAAPRDTDGDGVPDSADLCPTMAPGERPDAFRPGCPVRDRDGDGVPDERDICVDLVQGPDADPMRPGCPAPDSDHDGVSDHADACPELGPGAIADPARPGCPDGDRDGDGYTDSRDRCPAQAETFNNITDEDGCPEAQAPMVEIRAGMIQLQGNPVNFGPASDRIIGRRSFDILDALAAVLRAQTPDLDVDRAVVDLGFVQARHRQQLVARQHALRRAAQRAEQAELAVRQLDRVTRWAQVRRRVRRFSSQPAKRNARRALSRSGSVACTW